MSNERKPLLSDERIIDMTWEYDQKDGDDPASLYERGLNDARRHYESLITTGKLRVVEYAEVWHPSVPEEQWRKWLTGNDPEFTMLVTKCCGRNPWTPPWLLGKAFIDADGAFNRTPSGYVCPGCGNPIKR